MGRLNIEQVRKEKEYLSKLPERVWVGSIGLTSTETDLFDTIEAQQQEIEQLKMETKFYVASHGLIQNCNGRYLLTKRSKENDYMPNKWDIPGGTVDAGETPISALLREIFEETGLNLDECKVDYIYTNTIPLPEKQYFQIVFKLLLPLAMANFEIKLDDEHCEYQWLGIEEIKKLDLIPFMKEYITSLDKKHCK